MAQNDNDTIPLKKEIALLSFRMASRYILSDKEDKQNLTYAQTLLNQAQQIAGEDESNARKLTALARRISRIKK